MHLYRCERAVKDTKGDTLLHVAARNNHKNIVKEVASPPYRLRSINECGVADTPSTQLLRRNCAYDTKNMQGKEAWELAFEFNYTDLGEYIRVKTGLPPMADSKVPNAQEDVDKAGGVGRGNEDDDLLGMLGEIMCARVREVLAARIVSRPASRRCGSVLLFGALFVVRTPGVRCRGWGHWVSRVDVPNHLWLIHQWMTAWLERPRQRD
jgi:hypothetical protein